MPPEHGLPDPDVKLSDKELLERLPNTGSCGVMTTFYFTFAYTDPNLPAIPTGGINLDPYWLPPSSEPACNAALIAYRKNIRAFVDAYVKDWNKELAGSAAGLPAIRRRTRSSNTSSGRAASRSELSPLRLPCWWRRP